MTHTVQEAVQNDFSLGTATHLQPEMQQARQTLKTASASAVEQIALKIQVFQRAVRGEQGEILQRVEAEIEPLQLR